MLNRKSLLVAMLATSLFACNNNKEDQVAAEKNIIDGKKFEVIAPGQVGVKDSDDAVAEYIKNSASTGRKSVYFIANGDSAVMSVYNPGYYNSNGGEKRHYNDMVDFERKEFVQAKQFAEQKPVIDSAMYYKDKYQKLADSLQNK